MNRPRVLTALLLGLVALPYGCVCDDGTGVIVRDGSGPANERPLWPLVVGYGGLSSDPGVTAAFSMSESARPAVIEMRDVEGGAVRFTLDAHRLTWGPDDRPVQSRTLEIEREPDGRLYRVEPDETRWLLLPGTVRVGMAWELDWKVVGKPYGFSLVDQDVLYADSMSPELRARYDAFVAEGTATPPTRWRFVVVRRDEVETAHGASVAWTIARLPADLPWGLGGDEDERCFLPRFRAPVADDLSATALGALGADCALDTWARLLGHPLIAANVFIEGAGPARATLDLLGRARKGPVGFNDPTSAFADCAGVELPATCAGVEGSSGLPAAAPFASLPAPVGDDREQGLAAVRAARARVPSLAARPLGDGPLVEDAVDLMPFQARFIASSREAAGELWIRSTMTTTTGITLPDGGQQRVRSTALVDVCLAFDDEGERVGVGALAGVCPPSPTSAQTYVRLDGRRFERESPGLLSAAADGDPFAGEFQRALRGVETLGVFERRGQLYTFGSLHNQPGGDLNLLVAHADPPRVITSINDASPDAGVDFTTLSQTNGAALGVQGAGLSFATVLENDAGLAFVEVRGIGPPSRAFWFGLDGAPRGSQALPLFSPALGHRDGRYMLADISPLGDLRVVRLDDDRAVVELRGAVELPAGHRAVYAVPIDLDTRFLVVTEALVPRSGSSEIVPPVTSAGFGGAPPDRALALFGFLVDASPTGVEDPLMAAHATEVTLSSFGITVCTPVGGPPARQVRYGGRARPLTPFADDAPVGTTCALAPFTAEDDLKRQLDRDRRRADVDVELEGIGWLARVLPPPPPRVLPAAAPLVDPDSVAFLSDGTRIDTATRRSPFGDRVLPFADHAPGLRYPPRSATSGGIPFSDTRIVDRSGAGVWIPIDQWPVTDANGAPARACADGNDCLELIAGPASVEAGFVPYVLQSPQGNVLHWGPPLLRFPLEDGGLLGSASDDVPITVPGVRGCVWLAPDGALLSLPCPAGEPSSGWPAPLLASADDTAVCGFEIVERHQTPINFNADGCPLNVAEHDEVRLVCATANGPFEPYPDVRPGATFDSTRETGEDNAFFLDARALGGGFLVLPDLEPVAPETDVRPTLPARLALHLVDGASHASNRVEIGEVVVERDWFVGLVPRWPAQWVYNGPGGEALWLSGPPLWRGLLLRDGVTTVFDVEGAPDWPLSLSTDGLIWESGRIESFEALTLRGRCAPRDEACNGHDDDCDGDVDEGARLCGDVGATCVDGACVLSSCPATRADCGGGAIDGCETPLGTVDDCLRCGDRCAPGASCTPAGCTPPATPFVAMGASFACIGRPDDGVVTCAGLTPEPSLPSCPDPPTTFELPGLSVLVAGDAHVCGLAGGVVSCAGPTTSGPPAGTSGTPGNLVVLNDAPPAAGLWAGGTRTCLRARADDGVWCVGGRDARQIPWDRFDADPSVQVLTRVDALDGTVGNLAVSDTRVCGVRGGRVVCHGFEPGVSDPAAFGTVTYDAPSDVSDLWAGAAADTFFVDAGDGVYATGLALREVRALGVSDTSVATWRPPVRLPAATGARGALLGAAHVCLVFDDEVRCAGSPAAGLLGAAPSTPLPFDTFVTHSTTTAAGAASAAGTCLVSGDATAQCTGPILRRARPGGLSLDTWPFSTVALGGGR